MGSTASSTGGEDEVDKADWDKVFVRLTGGNVEGAILDNTKPTNLGPRRSSAGISTPRRGTLNVESDPFLKPPSNRSSFMKSTLVGSRSSIFKGVTLPDPKSRVIVLDNLENYVMGEESYTLEIEYGLPRSQLCRLETQRGNSFCSLVPSQGSKKAEAGG
jgi:hypothetical protein